MVKLSETSSHQANILDKIYIDNLESEKDFTNHSVSYRDPVKDILFDHDFIANKINKFRLVFDGCHNCNQVMKHFSDQRSLTDSIAEKQITWVKFKDSIMSCPFPHLKTQMTDPLNINLKLPPTRRCGWICVTWQALPVGDNTEFLNMAHCATMAIMKNLQNRPLAVKELQYKLSAGL